jgi:NAD(P)-dependent dehydrogenase (short-subunit alcohol dehydrogenase family)
MHTNLRDRVVVITGASSGIGRATAQLFAQHGANVVLAARSGQSLEEVATACESAGVHALAVPTDVNDSAAVRELACRAATHFGWIDVWVNCAAVALFARAEEAPEEAHLQVIKTNLFGYIHGALAVVPHFRQQRRGILINVSSIAGAVGVPYISSYVASKAGIRGFSDALRQELRDVPGIHVCTVLPVTIDTPLYQHAANYTGLAIQAVPPIYRPESVARAIVSLALRPMRERPVGAAAWAILLGQRLSPALIERAMAAWVERTYFQARLSSPTPGNLFEPMPEWNRISGGWKGRVPMKRSLKLAAGRALSRTRALLRSIRR